MKIVVTQTDELKSSLEYLGFKKSIKEYLIYLVDDSGKSLSCEIGYGEANKNDLVNNLLIEHFLPTDWENNKHNLNIEDILEEVSFEEYLDLEKHNV